MKVAGAIKNPADLPEGKKAALLTLLTDEDPAIHELVRKNIIACGPGSTDWLKPHLRSEDPVLRRRVQDIVLHFESNAADDCFLGFCLRAGEEFDLEEGAWLLAKTRYPEINVEAYQALLDGYAGDLQDGLEGCGTAEETLATLNDYLFDRLGFHGNEEDYYDPENSYLNRVVDRRTGNPITLCLVYLLLGKRLGLPMTGIGLPGHFLCRFQSTAAEVYVDVFHGGRLLSKGDCVRYLLNANFGARNDYLSPVTPRRLLLRVCANLHQVYLQSDARERATRLQRYMVALGR